MDRTGKDINRLKSEYRDRNTRFKDSDLYSTLNTSYLFIAQQRQRATVDLFKALGIKSLADQKLLEVGCGHGDVLQEYMFHRLLETNLYGAELISDRLTVARRRFQGANLVLADAQRLPYPDQQFDLVLQYMVFSSILDKAIKANIASEMLRVLKPGGTILWYDFWLNPTNPHTKGIRKPEIRSLFPSCNYTFRRITLAPPVSRKLVPVSWTLSAILEKLIVLNTHFLVAIRPK